MADKIKELETEIASLKDTIKKAGENFEDMKAKAKELNDSLQSDNDLLKEEIAGLKKAPKKDVKEEIPTTPEKRGYTLVSDLKTSKEQTKKNGPEK